MPLPRRHQRSRAKGARLPEGVVYVGRPSKWGSPFDIRSPAVTAMLHHAIERTKEQYRSAPRQWRRWMPRTAKNRQWAAKELYRSWLLGTLDELPEPVRTALPAQLPVPPSIEEIAAELGGREIACWCSVDAPCHGDVLRLGAKAGRLAITINSPPPDIYGTTPADLKPRRTPMFIGM
ncbi:DUF4326 domain-containing protein [Chelatococcus sp. XZ-Ab1]|uniref:DUF4326 domain-containing protein n=1 Tax=Chelatococcus sp. XZ-Ab1 TaxID=3034027 RepID=UPI0023E370DE|nr:DUF4326 domain-containing protein [Chelatococcus sp. XZ-Ab1]